MDKYSIITQALRRLGEREYTQDSAVYEPVNIYFDSVMRECNSRHHWSFARRFLVPLKKPQDYCECNENLDLLNLGSEGTENAPEHSGSYGTASSCSKAHCGASYGQFLVPLDCLRIMAITDGDGHKVRRWHLGVDENTLNRIVYVEDGSTPYATYTADLIQCGSSIPDHAPMFCQGVISLLAGRLAPSMLGKERLGQQLIAEAETYLKEAILQDKRQDRSNDQHPLIDIINQDVIRGSAYSSQLFYS